MKNNYRWAKLCLLGLSLCLVSAQAEGMKGFTMSGTFEGGYALSWTKTPASITSDQVLVDHLGLKTHVDVSDKVKIVINKGIAIRSGSPSQGLNNAFNTTAYYSPVLVATAGGVGGFLTFAVNSAYLEHRCHEKVTTWVGHFKVPFGMESMWERYDMHTYYYSGTHTVAQGYGWFYDTGAKIALNDVLPGTMELAVVDGRNSGQVYSPAAAWRWYHQLKMGDGTITPVLSVYAGKWRGEPSDLGFSGGLMWKSSGSVWANAEFMYTSNEPSPTAGTKNKYWGIFVEPGAEFGGINVSAKAEYNNMALGAAASTNDWNVGLALSHDYSDKLRVKLAYQHLGINGNFTPLMGVAATHINDVRILLATKW